MKVIVFGASGKVGQILVKKLINDNYEVTGFIHSHNPFKDYSNLKLIKGDIYKPGDVEEAIKGVDAVVCVLGSWGTKRKDVVSEGVSNIIIGMNTYKVSRIISLTGSDAVAAGDTMSLVNRLTHFLISVSPMRKILIDGESHIALLAKSNLDWTTVRSPAMNNRGNPRDYSLSRRRPLPISTINRISVASAIVDLLKGERYIKQAPYITRT